ncbi:Ber1p [Sugiyamaella lignohabitans]|uniref:Ber1p n=1 Tax=Sugiyamaella lignohabitans TaxID=796027 RepID=A0A167D8C7_9ASCO|nr:Ber1p [Sugiyamaella lignohabitans]ANB12604.1 Ber1p [Sugiyamaella lignohabitans]
MSSEPGFKLIERPISRRKNRNSKNLWKEKSAEDYKNIIDNLQTVIKNSPYYAALLKALGAIPGDSVKYIRCLALGSPTSTTGIHCQYQLALLIILLDHFKLAAKDVTAWDPVFESKDLDLLKLYGFDVVEEVTPGDGIPDMTEWLYYMPHAPHILTERVLKAVDSLPRGVILGNDLLTFDTRVIDEGEESTKDIAFVRSISKQLVEGDKDSNWAIEQIPNFPLKNANWMTAFYDMSVHIKHTR